MSNTRKHFSNYILFVLALLTVGSFSAVLFYTIKSNRHKKAAIPESIITLAERGDKIVTNGSGKLVFTHVRVDSATVKTKERYRKINEKNEQNRKSHKSARLEPLNYITVNGFFAFQGENIRCDTKHFLPEDFNFELIEIYNGKKTYTSQRQQPNSGYSHRTQKGNRISLQLYDPRFYGMSILGMPVSRFLKKQKITIQSKLLVLWSELYGFDKVTDFNISSLTINENEVIDGWECSVFQGYDEKNNVSLTVWLASELLFRPVKIVINAGANILETHTKFHEYEKNLWFPANIVIDEYYINKDTGKKVLCLVRTLDVDSDFSINDTIPENIFTKYPVKSKALKQ